MRKLSLVVALVLCLPLMAAVPALAWEFHLTGKMNWEFRGVGQLGNEGFFGPWNVDESSRINGTVTAHNLNFWAGYLQMDPASYRDIASTHAVLWNSFWMDFEPEIRLNPAIRLRSIMRIGSWRHPENFTGNGPTAWLHNPVTSNAPAAWGAARQGALDQAVYPATVPSLVNGNSNLNAAGNTKLVPPWAEVASGFWLPNTIQSQNVANWLGGAQVSMSPIYVNSLWVTAQTPWGIIVFGKRPAPFGMGLMFDGYETTSESLTLVAPYGPFRLGVSFAPWSQGDPLAGLYGDWYNPYDAGNERVPNVAPFFTYENGPLSMGAIVAYNFRHRDPGGILGTHWNSTARRDNVDYILSAFMKYNNGRLFFNGEIAHYDRARYEQGVLTVTEPNPNVGGPVTGAKSGAPWYIEDWRYAFELGCLMGPAKVTLFGAWLSGPDRRAGVFIDRSPMQFGNGAVLGNGSVFEPYSPIFVRNYGSGCGAYNVGTRKGVGSDIRALACRVDYAVAANLNTYASAWYAERNGNGYGWGWLRPEMNWAGPVGGAATAPTGRANANSLFNSPLVFAFYGGSPHSLFNWGADGPAATIPSADLGWEVNAGWQWKLLEGLEFTGDIGCWWPGSWFSYACISRANPNWNDIGGGGITARASTNQWGTVPGRLIDPVYSWSIKLITAF